MDEEVLAVGQGELVGLQVVEEPGQVLLRVVEPVAVAVVAAVAVAAVVNVPLVRVVVVEDTEYAAVVDVVDEILAVVAIVAAVVEVAAAVAAAAAAPFEELHCLEKRGLVARIARLGDLALFAEVDKASPISATQPEQGLLLERLGAADQQLLVGEKESVSAVAASVVATPGRLAVAWELQPAPEAQKRFHLVASARRPVEAVVLQIPIE